MWVAYSYSFKKLKVPVPYASIIWIRFKGGYLSATASAAPPPGGVTKTNIQLLNIIDKYLFYTKSVGY